MDTPLFLLSSLIFQWYHCAHSHLSTKSLKPQRFNYLVKFCTVSLIGALTGSPFFLESPLPNSCSSYKTQLKHH